MKIAIKLNAAQTEHLAHTRKSELKRGWRMRHVGHLILRAYGSEIQKIAQDQSSGGGIGLGNPEDHPIAFDLALTGISTETYSGSAPPAVLIERIC